MLTKLDRRKLRIRNKIAKSNKTLRPRIVVSRSNQNIYAQLINVEGKVLHSFSTLSFEENKKATGLEKAKMVGQEFAKICLKGGAKAVVFDKGAYAYSGRVKVLAEACREAGLQF